MIDLRRRCSRFFSRVRGRATRGLKLRITEQYIDLADNLFVAVVFFHAIEKIVVHVVMVGGHAISVFQGQAFRVTERVQGFVQVKIGDFLFGQISCRLQESNVESREAVVVAGDPQANQLDQLGGD